MAVAYNSTKIHGNSELHGCIYVHEYIDEYIGSPIIKKLNAGHILFGHNGPDIEKAFE